MRILLATDGSGFSEAAATFLTRFDWSPQDSITAFHAIYAVPFPEDRTFHSETLATIKKEIAPRILDEAMEILKPVRAGLSVEIGEFPGEKCTPDECILRAAESAKADVIVMGARGVKGMASVFLGSVARLVTAHASLPVLVVKQAVKRSHTAMRVLFAVDGLGRCDRAAKLLLTLPFPGETELTVLNVIDSAFSDIPERFVTEVDDRIKEAVAASRQQEFAASEKVLEEARILLGKRFGKVSALSRVGDPAMEIVNTAGALEADLIVAGCRGLRGVKRMVASVTRNVLSHATCPLLIAKTESS
jgi:nucleotide-binding universal stress UspA family protein